MNVLAPLTAEPFVPRLSDLRHGVNEQTVEWNEHEQTSITGQIEAENLLGHAGSTELAKAAVDSAPRGLG